MPQLILLERVENLGQMGDVVTVKPGYARNYLLPQQKALRASKENVAYFEAQKKALQAENDKAKKEAEKQAKTIEGIKVSLIRQASESGQLFGSVTSRDIAQAISETSKTDIEKKMVSINRNFKTIGLFPVDVYLHPEVKVEVTINIARSTEEAEIQAETGKALISAEDESLEEVIAEAAEEAEEDVDANLEEVLEDSALEIEKEKAEAAEEEAKKQAEADAKSAERKAKKEAKAAEEAEEEPVEAEDSEEAAEAKDADEDNSDEEGEKA